MIRATTPTFTLTVTGKPVDLSLAENVYVTLKQGSYALELTGEDLTIDENVISCFLNQEQSLRFTENSPAKIQVNWTYIDPDGITVRRAATKVKEIPISEQLMKRVIS